MSVYFASQHGDRTNVKISNLRYWRFFSLWSWCRIRYRCYYILKVLQLYAGLKWNGKGVQSSRSKQNYHTTFVEMGWVWWKWWLGKCSCRLRSHRICSNSLELWFTIVIDWPAHNMAFFIWLDRFPGFQLMIMYFHVYRGPRTDQARTI